ncbi:hypothetical protein M408DRAFT_24970 [Serendipita vermifera MAFF 305830]|uniref:F-box domain-containing protein n=1 Tax=Serendipita vermifera MAFF 305830 TaxID=933852 RepID=A0A0C2XCV8_SERVB|nr:hypothetical protein M408DRAFT_24970 [Serendipita vermifera MAFF 305830]
MTNISMRLIGILPEEIWYPIFREMDTHTSGFPSLSVNPAHDVNAPGKRELINLASTCKVIRKYAEPILFSRLVFDQHKQRHRPTFWDNVIRHFDSILRKQELKYLVRSFAFYSSTLPTKSQSEAEFWRLFSLLLTHFSALETIRLDIQFAYDHKGFFGSLAYPLALKQRLFTQHTYQRTTIGKDQKHVSTPAVSRRVGTFFTSWMPCIPKESAVLEEVSSDQVDNSSWIKTEFTNITNVALATNSHWLLAHCPNLHTFVSLKQPGFYRSQPAVLSAYFSALRSLTLDTYAHKVTLEGIIKAVPMLEVLRLYPPLINHFHFTAVTLPMRSVDEDKLLIIPTVVQLFPKLGHFGLLDFEWKLLFFEDDMNEDPSSNLKAFIQQMGQHCKSLQSIHLGRFAFRREEHWECSSEIGPAKSFSQDVLLF